MTDNVNHPSHYKIAGRKECIEEIADYGQTVLSIFCLTNAYKYLYRAGLKDGNTKEQDLAKAEWYLKYYETQVQFWNIRADAYRDYIYPLEVEVFGIYERFKNK